MEMVVAHANIFVGANSVEMKYEFLCKGTFLCFNCSIEVF
jgi:hypothetical protein